MIYLSYLWLLLQHKWYVFVAGLRVGGIPIWRLIVHDWSKFSQAEFGRYARHTAVRQGKLSQSEEIDLEFAYAWLHHENSNPHHWGYWIPRSGRLDGRPLAMPETYVREMVADWLGAERAYNGRWDMTEWLDGQLPRLAAKMDDQTIVYVLDILKELDYEAIADRFFANWFGVIKSDRSV